MEEGVTIHWHGVDVPNAEDGVAGVTQNAVLPDDRYTYRFRAEQVGTFWYHTHQVSSKEVRRGLFGVLVIEPREAPVGLDLALAVHTFDGVPTINGSDELERRKVEPGTPVRLRLVNTDSFGQQVTVSGSPFRVVAIDGTDLNGPTPTRRARPSRSPGAAGSTSRSRCQRRRVRVTLLKSNAALALSADGKAAPRAELPGPDFDPLAYGRPAPAPFGATTDRVRPSLRAESHAKTRVLRR